MVSLVMTAGAEWWAALAGWHWTAHAALGVAAALVLLALGDLLLARNSIRRNFPVLGHLRFVLMRIGPELRQYIVAHNREELPFSRSERDWIYRSAEGANNFFGFGTDENLLSIGYPIIKHSAFPRGETSFAASVHDHRFPIPSWKVWGEWHRRRTPWRPGSVINISAMSYGALGRQAHTALNLGAQAAGCYHNTGEGGFSPAHNLGADVVYQIGTGYFGCRTADGRLDLARLVRLTAAHPKIRGLEVKLSQGAKPGKGGVLPAPKVTPEIAAIRGVPAWEHCISPNAHAEFADVPGLIDFIERLAGATGLPVGIKSAVGHLNFWEELADRMAADPTRGPDWITIDGGEGGTGSAPLTFADHVSLPFRVGFPRVYALFLARGIAHQVCWIASAKLGFPDRAVVAFALGVDLINIAREAMLSIGCIQAQKCHTGHCPSGVATQSWWLQRGLKPKFQARQFQRYLESFRKELLAITHAVGHEHPTQFTMEDVEVSVGPAQFATLKKVHGYESVESEEDLRRARAEAAAGEVRRDAPASPSAQTGTIRR